MFGVKEGGGRGELVVGEMRGGLVSVCSRFYSRAADEMEMSQAEPGRARGLTVVHRMKILDIKQDREEKRRKKNEKKQTAWTNLHSYLPSPPILLLHRFHFKANIRYFWRRSEVNIAFDDRKGT